MNIEPPDKPCTKLCGDPPNVVRQDRESSRLLTAPIYLRSLVLLDLRIGLGIEVRGQGEWLRVVERWIA
jgi:hypothetical protein